MVVAFLVAGSLLGLRTLGTLEGLELAAYDWLLRLRPRPEPDSRIVLITVSERDIQEQKGWPLPDGVLAEVLEGLARHRPRVVGVDIYRDLPVPPGTERLHAILASEDRVIAVMKFGDGPGNGIPAPPALQGSDRVGFNDVLVDPGGIVRRGLLFLDDSVTTHPSFALQVALRYLADEGIAPRPGPGDPTRLRLGPATIRPFDANDGGYVGADARGYQFLLDFGTSPNRFAEVSLTDLRSGRANAGALAGKIVLIGVTAESVKDHFYTPYSRGLTTAQHSAGIEIHAHVVSQLLRVALDGARPFRSLENWQEALVVLGASAAGAALALVLRGPGRLLLAVGGGVLALGGLDFVALLRAWWLPLVPPALGWVGSAAIVTAYVSYHAKAERKMLMQLFSRHVSKEVADVIWEAREQFLDGGRPRPQRLTVTALFTDLTGFTTVAERLPPEQLMEWLNEHMEVMAGEVSRHGGVIRQYAGDAIVALFGVPLPRNDAEVPADAANAVDCALAMAAALHALNRRWLAEGRPTAGMRIGIFTGPVVAGSLGSAERSEYVVVGDTMNTASRLESFDKTYLAPDPATQPCRILIGEPTLVCVGDRYETEWVGEVSLHGKTKPVPIHRVIGRARDRFGGEGDST